MEVSDLYFIMLIVVGFSLDFSFIIELIVIINVLMIVNFFIVKNLHYFILNILKIIAIYFIFASYL